MDAGIAAALLFVLGGLATARGGLFVVMVASLISAVILGSVLFSGGTVLATLFAFGMFSVGALVGGLFRRG